MFKTVMVVTLALALSGPGFAQAAKQNPATPEGKPNAQNTQPRAPAEPPPLPVNIKIEVSITDQTGTNPPAKKVVSMIASDRSNTNIRSSASVPVRSTVFGGAPGTGTGAVPVTSYNYRNVTINVDARPSILQKDPTKISVSFGLEYFPKSAGGKEDMEPGMASWSERLALILESGKPMVVSQAADPTSDRKITVEVTATILK